MPVKPGFNERVASFITYVVNSMWFLYGFGAFIVLWMEFAPRFHWDTAPQYPVMLYWVNLFQAVMLPVLAVGQSVLNRQNRKRQELEFEIVQKLDRVLTGVDHRVETIDDEVKTLGRQSTESS